MVISKPNVHDVRRTRLKHIHILWRHRAMWLNWIRGIQSNIKYGNDVPMKTRNKVAPFSRLRY